MSPDSLDRLERLFRAARMHPVAERAAFLDAACTDDPALRRELENLLQADSEAEEEAFLHEPADGLAAQLPTSGVESSLTGRQIGPYTLLRLLGRGGMGDVYLAVREQPFRRYVALKIVRQGMDTRELLQRFEMERQILAALDHPGIARLLDGGMTEDGLPYFAMEYVEGQPLTTYCDQHRMSLEDRLRLFQTVCQAVQYAHQNLVIHRDLKPSNMLVTEENRVKLLDFGIAKLLNPHLSHVAMPVTRTELRMMTPEYASPEQVRGDALTTGSDVYALGVILYELLTGHRPYRLSGRSTQEIVRLVCEQDPERPSIKVTCREPAAPEEQSGGEIAPEAVSAARDLSIERLSRQLRGDLDNIVLMALRKEPGRRYGSAEQLGQDIERYLSGLPVVAHRDSRGYRLRKFIHRHRVETMAAVVVVLSLLSGLGMALWQMAQTGRERDRAEQALGQSEAVTEFLMRLFEASDPATSRGDEVKARELLERGVGRIEELQPQPLLQAQLLDVMGRVYQSMGQYETAQRLLERALSLRRSRYGEEHLLVAESMTHLGIVLTHRGNYGAAEPLLRRALAVQRTLLREAHSSTVSTLMALGYLLPFRGDWNGAEEVYREVLTMRRQLLGPEHPLVANSLINLAAVLRSQGRYDEAEVLFREALVMHRNTQGEMHPNVAWSMFQLALLLEQKDAYDEAESLLRRALEVQRTSEGETHPFVSSLMFELGEVLHERGNDAEAEPMLREALMLRRQVLGAHPSTADGLLFLAIFLHSKGNLAEAESLYQESLEMRRTLLGSEHFEVAVVLRRLASLYMDRGHHQKAESLLHQALTLHRKAHGADHHHVGETLTALAQLHRRMDDLEKAEALYQEALAVLRKSHSEAHVTIQELYEELIELYDTWGRPEAADAYRTRLTLASQPLPEAAR